MEYMLLSDGAVRVCDVMPNILHIQAEMTLYDGVAYYWHNTTFGWSVIFPDSTLNSRNHRLDPATIPEVVRLAHMLCV